MGSSQKTPNYDFPQFIDTDKPSWRGDINDFAITADSALAAIDVKVTNAVSTANGANTTASNALTLVQSLESSVSSDLAAAVTQATNANNAANNALSAAQTANQNASSAQSAVSSVGTSVTNLASRVTTVENGQSSLANSVTAVGTAIYGVARHSGGFQYTGETGVTVNLVHATGNGLTFNATRKGYTIDTAGVYHIHFEGNVTSYDTSANSTIAIQMLRGSTTTDLNRGYFTGGNNEPNRLVVDWVGSLQAGDNVWVVMGGLSIYGETGDASASILTVTRIGS